ncbi:hypothetical protein PVK06_011373 [Gossypium arboreum]|uniref:Uncharacterized protein n=1 Tax=Gossypium arboreum TaxID=29729 RepID=A0ABR0Q8Z9_GOSAR|nr:hypothetical protein PVK06_011373 [Gossypium arboreum]
MAVAVPLGYILLILEGYDLEGFVLGTVSVPPSHLHGPKGQYVDNPAFLIHKKQDKFLDYWLLSTVTDEVLVHLTSAKTSFVIWTVIRRIFGARSNVKLSSMRYTLYSPKKIGLTVKEYLAKVKSLSDNLIAVGSMVIEQEQANLETHQKQDSSEISKHTSAPAIHTSTNMVTEGKDMVGLVDGVVAVAGVGHGLGHNVSYVAKLVTQLRCAITDLMRPF